MALKESERSLRAYFLFIGAMSVVLGCMQIHFAIRRGGSELSTQIATYLPIVSGLILGVASFWAGLKLKTALVTGAGWIKTMLVVSGVMMFVNGALAAAVMNKHQGAGGLFSAMLGLAITIYLHRSVTRLAAEAAARAGIAAPPPTAKVV